MDMQVPHALLEITEKPDSTGPPSARNFSSPTSFAPTTIRRRTPCGRPGAPTPRPSFNPDLAQRSVLLLPVRRETDAQSNAWASGMPIEYTVLASAVPGVFNLGGDLDLFMQLIERTRPARLAAVRQGVHRRALPQLHRPWPAGLHHLARAGRMPRAAASRRRCPATSSSPRSSALRLPGDPVQPVPRHGRLFVPRPQGGQQVTEELLSTGKVYTADEMLAMGVVDCVVGTDRARRRWLRWSSATAAAATGWSASPAPGAG